MKLKFIKCHGSGNDFVMIDAVAQSIGDVNIGNLAVDVCDRSGGIGADGILLLVREGGGYAMRMFNPDGSEAEMCGNGIRCVARLARRYVDSDIFTLRSGGRDYTVSREAELGEGIETFGVRIPIALRSADFGSYVGDADFVGRTIPELDADLRFTALSLGNPHIAAECGKADMAQLERLGERVKGLKRLFPNGVNVSLFEVRGENEIFVATFERGAGITLSCGTAMTASTTAAALLGLCGFGRPVTVRNRGGMVRCECLREPLVTKLTGNATFEYAGTLESDGEGRVKFDIDVIFDAEINAYGVFAEKERGL
ncbi:MAG: diaminopimelate epimerase [Alistipes sp.]|nr:diaminopimelate epimerase [Alistipes sp.]